ncbi:hypothetical protein HMPREF1092_02858 [Clostridium thermobutyricum]|uniref:Uncharacterized protein n=1 Tax=Clostridium thermobutyricum TaxID=29372 RepID=N9XJ77_9CLOT|nr:hypothetical protein [Clostridium thermobutyricum]ENY99722.1 hypothetical protein HMPREF1092_02858 [Clostridium thermobutyricum]
MKKLNKKYYELISELEKSLNDFEVKEDKNLTKILTEYKDKFYFLYRKTSFSQDEEEMIRKLSEIGKSAGLN